MPKGSEIHSREIPEGKEKKKKISVAESWGSPMVLPLLLTARLDLLPLGPAASRRDGAPGMGTLRGDGDPPVGTALPWGTRRNSSRDTNEEQKRTWTGLYFKMLIYFLCFFLLFSFSFFLFFFFHNSNTIVHQNTGVSSSNSFFFFFFFLFLK